MAKNTSQPPYWPATEFTLQRIVRKATMSLITRKCWILNWNWTTRTIKEAIYSEENKHHINGITFKLPAKYVTNN